MVNLIISYPMKDPWCCYIWCSMDPIKKKPYFLSINFSQHHPDPSWDTDGFTWIHIPTIPSRSPRPPSFWSKFSNRRSMLRCRPRTKTWTWMNWVRNSLVEWCWMVILEDYMGLYGIIWDYMGWMIIWMTIWDYTAWLCGDLLILWMITMKIPRKIHEPTIF